MQIKAQTDCIIVQVYFKDEDIVKEGAEVLTVEVCKMMIPYNTNVGGTIKYLVKKDDYVQVGAVMVEIV